MMHVWLIHVWVCVWWVTVRGCVRAGIMGLGMAKNLLKKRGHRLLVWNRCVCVCVCVCALHIRMCIHPVCVVEGICVRD
jgi:hypothetical protein